MIYLLSHIVENSARKSPNAEAFRYRGEALTFAELDARATQLAATLHRSGVVPGDRVAVHMRKCLETAVSVFGCLKAGAVYVPVDPGMPGPRLKSVLDNADVSAILTQQQQWSALSNVVNELTTSPKLVVGVEAAETIAAVTWDQIPETADFVPPTMVEDDAAYIMYTSGSTGEPKGILHTHRSGLSYARLAMETYGVRDGDRLGNFAPLHFDQSTFEFFAGPLSGATTVLIPEEHTRFPASLSKLIEEERLTFWYSVPFALVQLLMRGALDTRDLSSLRWVLYGGEPFPPDHLRDFMNRLPDARFSNVYGPAEVNQCTYFHLPEPPAPGAASIPIGKVWQNTQALIVDDEDQPVPAGDVGELLIRSSTMMVGYWRRPELNAKVFCVRTKDQATVRFFRTGDLVQELPDGNMIFHGRRDRQVKIRGHRVELDEVEAAILKAADVEQAAVVTTIDTITDSRQIVAAVVPRAGNSIEPAEILAAIAAFLPAYAIPATIFATDEFPETTTGKTDYRALEERILCASPGGTS